ncbi:MAG: helicase C-terminal domain-containing protein [Candidatus Thorarchaeota archaeon]|jgi:DNA excision repair protein ERCC-2
MTERLSASDYFPYDVSRKGQDNMMEQIEKAVRNGQQMIAEAPNGFGKTITTLCGVLPWVQESYGKVLYCARTHKQLDRVIEELEKIAEQRLVTGVSFRGRHHMCLNEFVIENAGIIAPIGEVCRQLKATRKCVYYEYLRKAGTPEDLLEDMPFNVMTAPDIIKTAKIRSYCPYELAKQLAKVVDVVALSYLYVFDPQILESFMPELETPLSKMVLVQDEAHNVPSTALDSASHSLTIGAVRQAVRESATYNDSLSQAFCRELTKVILASLQGMGENDEKVVMPHEIYEATIKAANLDSEEEPLAHMITVGTSIQKALLKAGRFPQSSIFRVAEFMSRWLQRANSEDFAFILSSMTEVGKSKRISINLVALDPTKVTRPILKRIHSSIAVSGTISPLDAYSDMLGFGDESIGATFESPFALRNRLGMIVEGIDTAYGSRNETLFEQLVSHCVAVAHATPGNTGIFTTSYFIAKSLVKAGLEERLDHHLFVEKQGSKSADNDKMIEEFKKMGEGRGAVLLGVQGGRNSEGGDFPGYSMNSVIVVGVPYARPTPRTEARIEFYDKKFDNRGRDYAYVLPAMTRATQAAGRPVRRLDDKGVVVLLDRRFATPYLRRFIPSWLKDVIQVMPNDPGMIAQQVERFFSD